MKRPPTFMPRSAFGGRGGSPRSRKDAALQLVSLEFGADRLERELEAAQKKISVCRAALLRKATQRRSLLGQFGKHDDQYG